MSRNVVLAVLLILAANAVSAECPPPQPQIANPTDVLDRFTNAGFTIRKSFAGKKEENQPAALSFTDASEGDSFYAVDLAIRHRGIDCSWVGAGDEPLTRQVLVSPSAEWHRSSVTKAEVNKITASANTEVFLSKTKWRVMPFAILKPSLSRDIQKDLTSGSASLLLSWMSLRGNAGPGRPLRRGDAFVARYYVYGGAEYHRNLPITQGLITADGVEATFAIARLYLEWYPFNRTRNEGQFQILTDASFREKVGGDGTVPESPWVVNASAIYYFDSKLRFGIGYEYETGRSPLNNFERLRTSSLNLRFKL